MLNIAIVGLGMMGKTHMSIYKNIVDARVVSVFDVNKDLGQKIANENSVVYYDDFENMIKEANIDVVDICIPTFLHEKFTLLAAKHKKHIICEKPVGLTLESLDRMISATKEAKVKLMIAQVVRFWPGYVEAKEMIEKNEFGKVKNVYANRLAQLPDWALWHKDPQKSGGGLFDLHIHDIDFLCYLFGKVKSVYATGIKEESGCWNFVTSVLNFENGVSATAEGIWGMTKGYPFTSSLRIVGEKKTYDYKMIAGFNLEDIENTTKQIYIYDQHSEPEKQAISEEDPYGLELKHFVECIIENKETEIITVENSREVLCTLLSIKKSLETGELVFL